MAILAKGVIKRFENPPTTVLHGIDLSIDDGDFVSIVGRSGSGKTTLLYLLSTLDRPTEGSIRLNNVDPTDLTEEALHDFRNRTIGYVFQFHYLLPELTVLENVLLPARKHRRHLEKEQDAVELLRMFGIENKRDRFPSQISGGEQQRVAIARALVLGPQFIFADEPTGNLDSTNGRIVMDLLKRINGERGATVILVTHEPEYAAMARRQIQLIDGRVHQSEI